MVLTDLYWLIVAEEERKGSGGARELDVTSTTDEMYDDFDGDAVQLGAVDMVAMMNSASSVGQQRRVTSQRLLSQGSFSSQQKPA